MDKRHTDIVEGAGLEESRINADFVDWLKRWGSPILIVVLVFALGYRGWMFLQTRKVQQLDTAYLDLDAATTAGQPVALVQVAEDWKGQPSISAQARLEAADRYLLAYATNLKPGGVAGVAEDRPSENERDGYLDQAQRLYEQVQSATSDKPNSLLLHIHALSGLASADASRRDFDAAIQVIQGAVSRAREGGFDGLADALSKRITTLESRPDPIVFVRQDQLPADKAKAPAPDAGGEFLSPDELLKHQGASEIGPPVPPAEEGATPATKKKPDEPAPKATPEPAPAPAPVKPPSSEPSSSGGG